MGKRTLKKKKRKAGRTLVGHKKSLGEALDKRDAQPYH